MKQEINIIQAIADSKILRKAFKDLATWKPALIFLAALFALPVAILKLVGIDAGEAMVLYTRCTGRKDWPLIPFLEVLLLCGRRSGKSFLTAVIAVFLACFRDYRPFLSPGEWATIAIISVDRHAARIVFNYIREILRLPMFKAFVVRELRESIELVGNVRIEIFTSDFRSVRGATLAACIVDEVAFLRYEGVSPDVEIATAIRPALKTIPGAPLIFITSPYAQVGIAYQLHKHGFGNDDPEAPFIWQAGTHLMNPTISEKKIQKELERDPASARAEWLAEFRSDIEAFLSRAILEPLVVQDRIFLPAQAGICYTAFIDPSGGAATGDEYTACIGHLESDSSDPTCIVDKVIALRGNPKVSTERIARDLHQYGVSQIVGDRYAGTWPEKEFERYGIRYTASELDKSKLYVECLPFLTSGKVQLLDDEITLRQFTNLERRTSSGGKDTISHPSIKGSHDDRANCVAGAIVHAFKEISSRTWEAPYIGTDGRLFDPMGPPAPLDFYERVEAIRQRNRKTFYFPK